MPELRKAYPQRELMRAVQGRTTTSESSKEGGATEQGVRRNACLFKGSNPTKFGYQELDLKVDIWKKNNSQTPREAKLCNKYDKLAKPTTKARKNTRKKQ